MSGAADKFLFHIGSLCECSKFPSIRLIILYYYNKNKMSLFLKKSIKTFVFGLLISIACVLPMLNQTYASNAPKYERDFAKDLTKEKWQLDPSKFHISSESTLRENIVELFYPSRYG